MAVRTTTFEAGYTRPLVRARTAGRSCHPTRIYNDWRSQRLFIINKIETIQITIRVSIIDDNTLKYFPCFLSTVLSCSFPRSFVSSETWSSFLCEMASSSPGRFLSRHWSSLCSRLPVRHLPIRFVTCMQHLTSRATEDIYIYAENGHTASMLAGFQ